MWSPLMAMSAFSISPVKTLTIRPFLRTRSAGWSPRATARSLLRGIESNSSRNDSIAFRRFRREELGDFRFAFESFDFAVDHRGVLDKEPAALVDGVAAED